MTITHGLLHHTIIKFIIDRGYAPEADELAALLGASEADVTAALHALADYHGVVLHPNSAKIWVIHPFATMPTNFVVRADTGAGEWWGNCAWDGLGIVAALGLRSASVTSGDVTLHVRDGALMDNVLFHVAVPAAHWWDDIEHT